jgi:hypothetical protein
MLIARTPEGRSARLTTRQELLPVCICLPKNRTLYLTFRRFSIVVWNSSYGLAPAIVART